jgi:hypothetical protein
MDSVSCAFIFPVLLFAEMRSAYDKILSPAEKYPQSSGIIWKCKIVIVMHALGQKEVPQAHTGIQTTGIGSNELPTPSKARWLTE